MILYTLFLLASFTYASLLPRDITTNATCDADFKWSFNEKGLSPCLVAAYVNAACGGEDYNVPKLNISGSGEHYSVSAEQANPCTCSWASYNLMSACTACQDQEPSIQTYASYRLGNCSNHLNGNLYFPVGATLRDDTRIPFWATTNPDTWPNDRFDVDQAQKLAEDGKADVGAPSSNPAESKKTPVGAIVGGVVGGIIIIALGVICAVMIHRRRQRAMTMQSHFPHRPPHIRSISDLSQKTTVSYTPYIPALGTVPASPGAPTIRTHNSSTHSLSVYGSVQPSVFSGPVQTFSQALTPPSPEAVAPANLPNVITPFNIDRTIPVQTSPSSAHRKLASESSDTTLPVSRQEESTSSGDGDTTPVRRLPPSYTDSVYESPPTPGIQNQTQLPLSEVSAAARRETRGHAHRPILRTRGSQESGFSWDSNLSGSRNISHDPNMLAGRIAMSLARAPGGQANSGASTTQVHQAPGRPDTIYDDQEEIPIA